MNTLASPVHTAFMGNLPLQPGHINDLGRCLREANVRYWVKPSHGLSDDPGLIGKIRGALGRSLLETASPENRAGRPCTYDPPCAYQVLWRNNGKVRPGFPMPAPLILRTDTTSEGLIISAHLFGFAADYLGEVSDALLRGLRRGLSGKKRQVLDPFRRDFAETNGVDLPALTRQVRLEFLTPVLFRKTKTAHMEPAAFLRSLVDRACGLAHWHGLTLDKENTVRLREAVNRIEGQWLAVDVARWRRGAVQQNRMVPMQGALGTLALRGDLTAIAPYLTLGEHFHVGGRTAWGLGRYRIVDGM